MTQTGGAHFHMLSLLSFALLYSCANDLNRRKEPQAVMVRYFAQSIACMCQEQAHTHAHIVVSAWPHSKMGDAAAAVTYTHQRFIKPTTARLHTYVSDGNDAEQWRLVPLIKCHGVLNVKGPLTE